MDFAEEIEGKEVTDEEAERIICAEFEGEDVDEYLVDGAVLSCTSAVWHDFPLSVGEKVHIEGAEKKTKDDKPTGILRVWENPMYTNGLHHANVTDTKQGLNILPFSCNCMEPATTEQEQKIIEYMDKCKKAEYASISWFWRKSGKFRNWRVEKREEAGDYHDFGSLLQAWRVYLSG